jgi:hypothetical protein
MLFLSDVIIWRRLSLSRLVVWLGMSSCRLEDQCGLSSNVFRVGKSLSLEELEVR